MYFWSCVQVEWPFSYLRKSRYVFLDTRNSFYIDRYLFEAIKRAAYTDIEPAYYVKVNKVVSMGSN
jgi:hypothetical protein